MQARSNQVAKYVRGLSAGIILANCPACSVESEPVRQVQLKLSQEQFSVLGFESPSIDWAATNGTPVGSSSEAVQGVAALAVSPSGYTEFVSAPIVALGGALPEATVRIRLPQAASWGQVRLVFSAPSAGIYWADLGGRELSTLAPGTFETVQFTVPGNVQSVLNGVATDIRYRLVMNVPGSLGQIFVDDLKVSSNQSSEDLAQSLDGELSISLPKNLYPEQVALVGFQSLKVGDRARVEEGAAVDLAGQVVNAGAGETYLGADTTVGSVYSVGPIRLRNRSTVQGDALSGTSISLEPDATILGEEVENADLSPNHVAKWTPQLVGGPGTDVVLEPEQAVSLSPGSYGQLHIKSRATITLSPGSYRFASVAFEPESQLVLSSTETPTVLYIDGILSFRGKMVNSTSPTATTLPLLFVTMSQAQVPIERPFFGTLYAPNGSVSVSGGVHHGAFFARHLEVQPDARIVHDFFPWGEILPPEVIKWVDAAVHLDAWAELDPEVLHPDERSFQEPVQFRIPEYLQVSTGNAGSGTALLHFKAESLISTCTYRGMAGSDPTSHLGRMKGLRYGNPTCTNGYAAGHSVEAEWIKLEVLGGDGSDAPVVGVTLDLGHETGDSLVKACSDVIPPPLLPEQVVELRDAFSWVSIGNREEVDPDGNPAMLHGAIYVRNKEQLAALDRLRVMWSGQPLIEAYRESHRGKCGRVQNATDGEGTVVYAIFPARFFNYIRAASVLALENNIDPPFDFIIPGAPDEPEYMHPDGSIKYSALASSGYGAWLENTAPAGAPGVFDDLVDTLGAVGTAILTGGVSIPWTLNQVTEEAAEFLQDTWHWVLTGVGNFAEELQGDVSVRLGVRIQNRDHGLIGHGPRGYLRRMWGKPCDRLVDSEEAERRCGPAGAAINQRPIVFPEDAKVKVRQWGLGILPVENSTSISKYGLAELEAVRSAPGRGDGDICIELEADYARFTEGLLPMQVCAFNGLDFSRSVNGLFEISQNDLYSFGMVKDAADYLKEVIGHEPHRADVLRGWWANTVTWKAKKEYSHLAKALCLDFAGVANSALSLLVGPSYAATIAQDIWWPDANDVYLYWESRGIMPHEYGHFAMCSMLRGESGNSHALNALLSAGLEGKRDKRSDTDNMMLEAFADLYVHQVVGGSNYIHPQNARTSGEVIENPREEPFAWCVDFNGGQCLDRNYAGDGGYDQRSDQVWRDELARYLGMFYDAFDTREETSRRQTNDVSNGDYWRTELGIPVNNLTFADSGFVGNADELSELGGHHWNAWIRNWLARGPNPSKDNVLGGLVDTIKEETNWCDACEVLALHDVDTPENLRPEAPALYSELAPDMLFQGRHGRWHACLADDEMSDLLGSPPDPYLNINSSCEACPPRFIVDEVGTCVSCPAMEVARGFECVPCAPGEVQVGNECVACGYGEVLVNNECVSCPVGFGPDSEFDQCLRCPADATVNWNDIVPACSEETARPIANAALANDPCPQEFWLDVQGVDEFLGRGGQVLEVVVDPLLDESSETACVLSRSRLEVFDVQANGQLLSQDIIEKVGTWQACSPEDTICLSQCLAETGAQLAAPYLSTQDFRLRVSAQTFLLSVGEVRLKAAMTYPQCVAQ